jgi:hypothetical protein
MDKSKKLSVPKDFTDSEILRLEGLNAEVKTSEYLKDQLFHRILRSI